MIAASWRLNEREVWRERCSASGGRVADSGKHANSFSYACEKVQEAPYARKGEGFGERGTGARKGGWRIYRLRVQLKVDFIW